MEIENKVNLRSSWLKSVFLAIAVNSARLYLTGGICFVVGTVAYFPDVNELNSGAALFTFGSLCYFLTDCAAVFLERDTPLADLETGSQHTGGRKRSTCRDSATLSRSNLTYLFWRSSVDAISSFSFCLGSILLFPVLDTYNPGILVFVIASAFGMLFRGTEMLSPYLEIPANFWAAWCCFVGYILFTVGSVLFLTWIHPTALMLWIGVMLFLLGSMLFVACTVIAFYEETLTRWYKQWLVK